MLAWVGAAAVVAFTALPVLYMVLLSLDPDPAGAATWPPRISGVNYAILAEPIFDFYPALVRSLLVATGTTRLFSGIGLFDQLADISLAQLSFAVPLGLWFITYAFRQVPAELEDAARLDGAGWRRWRRWSSSCRGATSCSAPGSASPSGARR